VRGQTKPRGRKRGNHEAFERREEQETDADLRQPLTLSRRPVHVTLPDRVSVTGVRRLDRGDVDFSSSWSSSFSRD
jgi:hypothetical protein